jgi:hypothetical protein
MKKQIPIPVVVGAVALVLAIGIFFVMQAGNPGPEFEAAPPTGKTPDYVLQSMTPEQRAKIQAQEQASGLNNMDEMQRAQQPQQNPYGGN